MSYNSLFSTDFRELLNKHKVTSPRFAHGSTSFDPKNPRCLYSGPLYDQEELVAATVALVEGAWSVAGEQVHKFEVEFSRHIKQKRSVMVNSGSSANLALLAAAKLRYGWKDGDEILVSPVGFPTTISAITLNNLTPSFVDIEWDTLNADNRLIKEKLESTNHKIKAIFVSPVLGNPPNIDEISELCQKYSIVFLMDGCDSLGSTWGGRQLSEYAVATTCSFFPSHHVSTLQGGMVSSNDEQLIKLVRKIITWGRDCHCFGAGSMLPNGMCGHRFKNWLPEQPDLILDHKYIFGVQGYNLQPLDLQGALGLEQIKKADEIHKKRRAAYQRVSSALLSIGLSPVRTLPKADPSWFGVPIVCPSYEYKTKFVKHLEKNGIQTRNYFAGNILLHPGYKHLDDYNKYPNANQVLRLVFFVGTNPGWSDDHFRHIETSITEFKS